LLKNTPGYGAYHCCLGSERVTGSNSFAAVGGYNWSKGGNSMRNVSKKRVFTVSVLVLFFIMTSLVVYQRSVNAGSCQIVKVAQDPSDPDAIRIEPTDLWIKKGDCVVWFNDRIRASKPEIMVKFREGKKCEETTDAPTGFKRDEAENCYITGMIPYGGTSSLRFMEKGSYEYEVMAGGKETAKGKIVVGE